VVVLALDGRLVARRAAVARRDRRGRVGRRERLDVRVLPGRAVGHDARVALVVGAAAVGQELGEHLAPLGLRLGQRDAVLRAARPGEGRLDVGEVEFDDVTEDGLLFRAPVVPEALLLRVGLDEVAQLLRAPGELEVAQRLGVDREDRARRAVLGAHVPDRRPVGERQRRDAGPEELDELAHDALAAQDLGDGQDEVGRRRALAQVAAQLEADDVRDEHRHRLAEHGRLGLDAADAPAEHAEPVDHRRVRVGPDERVRVRLARRVAGEHDAREVLEVHLVDDPGVRRDDGEVGERALAPAQERVALAVALELALGVQAERVARAERVDLDRVVDDELGRHERVDLLRVAADLLGHRVAHRGEVDDGGDAGEVLHDHARGAERDLERRVRLRVPRGQRLDRARLDRAVALGAQEVLEQDLEGEGQPGDVEARLQRVEAEDLVGAVAHLQVGAR
jgi:hypothetical protein